MVMSPFPRRTIDSGVNPFRALLTTLIPAFILGFGQATILWLVQVGVLGVEPEHPVLMLASLWFISWVFMSVITAINLVFGDAPGRLITMALMSLQLVASNGLYPPEVQPEAIQLIHNIDPMRFTVDLLRHALFGSHDGDPRLPIALGALAFIAVGAWAISTAALWYHRVIMDKDIHPELAM